MAQFQRRFVQELNKPLIVRQCGDLGFSGDNDSDVISVDLYTDGEPYSGGGTCAGACICPDGSTVALTGSVSENTASVTLTEDCFAIPGQISIAIRVTSGTTKTTVLKAIYNVEPFSTNNPVDPGSRIALDVGDLVNRIDAAVESIPASADQLKAAMATNFSATTAYPAGAYVWYNGTLYKFTTAHAPGSWTGTDAVQIALSDDLYEIGFDLSASMQSTRNLVDISKVIIGDLRNGNVLAGTHYITDYIPVVAGYTYCFSGNCARNGYEIDFFDSTKAFISRNTANTNYVVIPANCAFVRCECYESVPLSEAQIQFEIGRGKTKYVPYSELKANEQTTDVLANTIENTRNLIDPYKIIIGNLNQGDITDTASNYVSDYIPVKASTTYVYSGNCAWGSCEFDLFDSNRQFLSRAFANSTYTVATTAEAAYIRIEVEPTVTLENAKLQLEEGTTATEFIKYISSVDDVVRNDLNGTNKHIDVLKDVINNNAIAESNLSNVFVKSNLIFARKKLTLWSNQIYYSEVIYSIPFSGVSVGDKFTFRVENITGATYNKPVNVWITDQSGAILARYYGANEYTYTVTAEHKTGNGLIEFVLYPATDTALTDPAVFENIKVYTGDTLTYDYQEQFEDYVTESAKGLLTDYDLLNYDVKNLLVKSGIIYTNKKITIWTDQQYYLESIYRIPMSDVSVGEQYALDVGSVENATYSQPIVIQIFNESGTRLARYYAPLKYIYTVTQKHKTGNGYIDFCLYPVTDTVLTQPAVFNNVSIYKAFNGDIEYQYQEKLTNYIKGIANRFYLNEHNVSEYTGEKISVFSEKTFSLEEVMSLEGSFPANPQAGTNYGKYFFQFLTDSVGFILFDMEKKARIQATEIISSAHTHNNNVVFSKTFYADGDEFPLLYASQTDEESHCVYVYRIINTDGVYSLSLIQTITWENPSTSQSYFPEIVLDNDNNRMIRISYKMGVSVDDPNNRIVIRAFDIPSLSSSSVSILDSSSVYSFELPYVSTPQGATYNQGKIYMAFGSESTASIRVIDIQTEQFVTTAVVAVPAFGTLGNSEPEGVFIYQDCICCNTVGRKIWKLILYR